MPITAFELLTEEQQTPFFRHSQLGKTLSRARLIVDHYELTPSQIDRLSNTAYWLIDEYKTRTAVRGLHSIIKQFDLPFDPEHPESAPPLEALGAMADIREDEPDRPNGEAIEKAADKVRQ